VKKQIRKSKVTNLHFIRSNCDTGLMDKSVDVILLFDVFHELGEPLKVLKELHRVLKDEGILSFSDHHLEHDEIMDEIAGSSLFKLANKREDHYIFSKVV
jgi:ubiquinone/menaquinone biosynthesis C-methylase UbiE